MSDHGLSDLENAVCLSYPLTGKVEHRDLEGGVWQLVTDGGERYTLAGAPADLKKAKGSRVEVEGSVDEGGFGLAMAGPKLSVRSFRVL